MKRTQVRRKPGLSLVSVMMVGCLLTAMVLAIAVDFTRQFNVVRQTEATYKDQYTTRAAVQLALDAIRLYNGDPTYITGTRTYTLWDRVITVYLLNNHNGTSPASIVGVNGIPVTVGAGAIAIQTQIDQRL